MIYDVIIIGSGPAGISASLYTIRANLKILIISKKIGTLEKVESIENYYGLENNLSGEELYSIGVNQAKKLGVEFVDDEVVKISVEEKFIVETINYKYEANSVIIATGSVRKEPNIKGIKELEGKGISYCVTCDGFFFKGKNIGVLGSGEYAVHEAKDLKRLTPYVTLLTNGEELVQSKELNIENIKIDKRKIKEFHGKNRIEKIEFEDNSINKIDGIFVAIGIANSSDLARKIGIILDENKNIKVDENMKTNIPKVYACGDCTGGILQISKAVYEGMVAGMSAIKDINRENK